jgi:hypothetical protein
MNDNGLPTAIGGKTGSGDNRIESFARGGQLISSRAVSRTASFVFYLDQRWFGVITASVSGARAEEYNFTSSLPLAVVRLLAPALHAALREDVPPESDDFYAFESSDALTHSGPRTN